MTDSETTPDMPKDDKIFVIGLVIVFLFLVYLIFFMN